MTSAAGNWWSRETTRCAKGLSSRPGRANVLASREDMSHHLAELFRATNRLADAGSLFRRALAIDEASLGPDHPNVARDLNNLAELLRATNRLAEAEPLYRRALAVDETSLGPNHPNVAIRLNNLALLLLATGSLAEAAPLVRRHLVIFLAFQRETGHADQHRKLRCGTTWPYWRTWAAIQAAIEAVHREAGLD